MKAGVRTALRPDVEGGARRVHLHRMRPLQGRLPDAPDRQAALAEEGERQPEAPSARAARRDRRPRPEERAAAAGGRRDQPGHAVGLHDLRLLRSGMPDRTRTPRQVLPHAPAAGDDRRRVPARTEEGVRGLGSAGQRLGPSRRAAWRLGERARRAGGLVAGRGRRARLSVLRRFGDVVRSARAEDRAGLRRDPAAGGGEVRHPGAARRLDRRVRAPPRQRDAVPAARREPGRDTGRGRRDAHRHLRPACDEFAAQRVPRFRRPLRGDPPHPADRRPARAGPHPRRTGARAGDLPRPLLPRAATTASSTPPARCWPGCAATSRSSSS